MDETNTQLPGGKPSISNRINICWPPAPAIEDSAVLVLSSCPYVSSPNTQPFQLYLDLRLSLPLSSSSNITWAFAGVRRTLRVDPHPKYRWDHAIDSRKGMEGWDTVDEGETIMMADGTTDSEIEVETGLGWNPQTGRVEKYNEVWSEENILPGSIYLFLILGDDPRTSKAFIAIVGPHALALSQDDESPFQAVRMVKSSPSPSTLSSHNGWDIVYSTSVVSFPLGRHCLQAELFGLLDQLDSQGNIPESWQRGDRVELRLDEHRTWTIFDRGVIGHL